jgi:hypothetical protein
VKWVLLLGVLSILVIEARAVLSGRAELRRADAASSPDDRLIHLRRAARWRGPLSPYPEIALDRLRSLAQQTRDPALALEAWEGIRGALLGTRVLTIPDPALLREANQHIAALRAASSSRASYDRQLAALEQVRGPSIFWSLVALAGFASWVTGGFCLPRRRHLSLGLVAVGLALFVVGLALA